MQFRFAAMESVHDDQHAQAASAVLIGGIAAAYIGPEVTLLGNDLWAVEFTGSFVLLAVIFILGLLVLLLYRNPPQQITPIKAELRPLRVISQSNGFWVAIFSSAVGYAVMSYIMTATPLSMHVMDGHSLTHTKWVIQSHIMSMYLPSLVIGWLLQKYGHKRIMLAGLIAYVLCMGMAFVSHDLFNYWVALILLGVGWNFLFVGGTALLPSTYRPEERFKVQAFNEFIVFGSQAAAAISAGWMVFTFGWEIMLVTTLPFIVFQLVLIGRWKR